MSQTSTSLSVALGGAPPRALEALLAISEEAVARYPGRQAKAGKRLRDKLSQIALRLEEGLVQARFSGYPPIICELDLEDFGVGCMCRASLRSDYCPHGYAVLLAFMAECRAEFMRREEVGHDWAGNLAVLDAFLAPPEASPGERVVWLVDSQARFIDPCWQRRKKSGRGWTKPQKLTLKRLVEDESLPRDAELERVARQVQRQNDWHFDLETAHRLLCDQFEVADLRGFGCTHLETALIAAGVLVAAVLSAQAAKQVLPSSAAPGGAGAETGAQAAPGGAGGRPGFFASGGMPSSHTAAMAALCVAVGRAEGFGSDLGALTVVLTTIVMYDAMNVRRACGEQAQVLNRLVEARGGTEEESLRSLLEEAEALYPCRVCRGHTGPEVLGGLAWGTLFGLLWTGGGA